MAVEKFPIEPGHVMMFARAIGDDNQIYFDEEYAKTTEVGTRIAPPTFPIADVHFDPERPIPGRPRPEQGEGGGGQRRGGGGLHAEMTFEYKRPLRVGETLTKKSKPGETWEREGRRGGKLTFSERISEYYDDSGELVAVAKFVGVQTERPPTPVEATA
jgi:hypothetical protein